MGVSNTGGQISVPVGEKTLGRIMDVLGLPIDNAGEVGAEIFYPCTSLVNKITEE